MSLNSFADITQKVFIIPRNQRGFAWTKQQFDSLVNDMRISLALGKDHYVGPVVVEGTGKSIKTKSTRTLTMVTLEDGQQRVTTLMMMCRLLAERIKSTFQATDREYDTARDLDRCYSYTTNNGSKDSLLQNENPEFMSMIKHILLGAKAVPAENSQPMIKLRKMRDSVDSWVAGIPKDELEARGNQILNALQFTLIDLSQDINKYLAFDAINSRGIDLSEFDKVKNFCCMVYNIRNISAAVEPEEKWFESLKILEDANCSSRLDEDNLICDLFNVHHGKTIRPASSNNRNGVHKNMVDIYNKLLFGQDKQLEDNLVAFVEAWDSFATSFAFVKAKSRDRMKYYPGNKNSTRCNADAQKEMIRLDNLNKIDATRLLLATCHNKFNEGDFAQAASLAEKFSFRIFSVMNKRTDTSRNELIKASYQIYHGEDLAFLKRVICYLLHRAEKGASLSSVVKELADGGTKYPFIAGGWDGCFYFLYEYETEVTGAGGYAWINDKKTVKRSIEHILPKTRDGGYWDKEWPDDWEFHSHIHRIGNLVLTKNTGTNSQLGQKSIIDKITNPNTGKYDYTNGTNSERKVHIHANKTGKIQWRPENILHRERDLLEFTVRRWGIDCCADREPITLPPEYNEDEETISIDTNIKSKSCIGTEKPHFPKDTDTEEE